MHLVFKKMKALPISIVTLGYVLLMNAQLAFAADAGQVKSKLTDAGRTIQGILTGLVVLVGICVALFIIIKRMPDADDPREKSEVYHAVGRVAGLVALAAAVIWLLPWVYSLFT
ncbi:MAG: CagC family type IV secretion system protein [Oenococcus sp.]|uniref:CagC family type IV secretion system protein n=1 Tax=Oenococcus TaxID=46254 RepID=UPI0008630F8C|nr:CagC family type IV secretion system protein [Oenococcus kitaharae]OEY84303.1 conjugal transfer protein [Oenococcus kitaharae]